MRQRIPLAPTPQRPPAGPRPLPTNPPVEPDQLKTKGSDAELVVCPPRRPAPSQSPPTAAEMQIVAQLYERFPFLFPGQDARDRVTVAEVVDRYLADAKTELAPDTYEYRTHLLKPFAADLGDRVIAELSPLILKEWVTAQTNRYKSGWSLQSLNVAIQRAFNWSVAMRLTRENPFKGFKAGGKRKVGREMTREEFQAVLRHSDPYFRRFMIALKLTGARPCELTRLKWDQINWETGVIVQAEHKSASKTGKPRRIHCGPQMMKLLTIIKRDQHGPAAAELRLILEHAPGRTVRAREVVTRMKQHGFTYRSIYRARHAIGAVYRRVGGWREHGHTVYTLPVNAVKLPPPAGDYVFTCSKQWTWKRSAIGHKFARLRELIGLPPDCKTYGVRHLFATEGVRRGLNLKVIATLMGHTTCAMIERVSCHINGDYKLLQDAAAKLNGLAGVPQPLPSPIDAAAWQKLIATKYPPVVARPKKEKPTPDPRRPLTNAEKIAWQAFQFAAKEAPNLKADFAVYGWLVRRREFAGQLPPSGTTFRRYLHRCRIHYHGMAKRKLRRATAGAKGGQLCQP